jgi:DNA-directed RNA polymerase subunit L
VKNDYTIKLTITAKPGSKLEQAILQALNDMKANIERLKDEYRQKLEQQQTKIERRL